MYIHALAVSKKNVPPLLKEPINLVRDIKKLVETHKNDDPALAVTGQPLLFWSGIKNDKATYRWGKQKSVFLTTRDRLGQFFKILSNGNKTLNNLVKWQRDFK